LKKHTKVYFNHFKLSIADRPLCEICGDVAVDIHHIKARGMGGDPSGKSDDINNLMALCRYCHDKYGDRKQYFEYLHDVHNAVLNAGN
jgi:5-methylcytosine-specific restriction endonuclease McrA